MLPMAPGPRAGPGCECGSPLPCAGPVPGSVPQLHPELRPSLAAFPGLPPLPSARAAPSAAHPARAPVNQHGRGPEGRGGGAAARGTMGDVVLERGLGRANPAPLPYLRTSSPVVPRGWGAGGAAAEGRGGAGRAQGGCGGPRRAHSTGRSRRRRLSRSSAEPAAPSSSSSFLPPPSSSSSRSPQPPRPSPPRTPRRWWTASSWCRRPGWPSKPSATTTWRPP